MRLVETRFPLHLNSLHDLRLELGERSVVVKGRVVHSQIADVDDDQLVYWTGIEFVEPSDHVSNGDRGIPSIGSHGAPVTARR